MSRAALAVAPIHGRDDLQPWYHQGFPQRGAGRRTVANMTDIDLVTGRISRDGRAVEGV